MEQNSKKNVCFVTGNRSDYGLIKPIMELARKDAEINLQLIVTGAHLSSIFGETKSEILKDGFKIDAEIDILLSRGDATATIKSMGVGLLGFADVFKVLKPEKVVILGDRYEALVAAQAALISRIPIAHIHGGEITEGAVDDSIRHAITKFSHLHFVAADEYRRRVIQLGEQENMVFNYGAPGLDFFPSAKWMGREEVLKKFDMNSDNKFALVALHPETIPSEGQNSILENIFYAIQRNAHLNFIFTSTNPDPGSDELIKKLRQKMSVFGTNILFRTSLGRTLYLNLMKHCEFLAGNSSSGVIEAPMLKVPSINIGNRQTGRLMAASVISVKNSKQAVAVAFEKALSTEFRDVAATTVSLYKYGNASRRIVEKLKEPITINAKKFNDIRFQ